MLPTFFLLCCKCVVVMLDGPFPSDSSTAHADPECLDESDKECAHFRQPNISFSSHASKRLGNLVLRSDFQAFSVFRA